MGKNVRSLLVIVLVVCGIGVMAYPSLSSSINARHSSYAVQQLHEQISKADPELLRQQRDLARQYNEALAGAEAPAASYEQILDFGNGVMGSIHIPKLDVTLEIYHGVSDAVLGKGVGHMPDSALPIGGPGCHTVLTGHTGLPGAELFTGLTELTEGDRFRLSVLGQELVYEVDQIAVVLPHQTQDLSPVRGRDYCTLVTCTPYGINSHRLLVRGERVQEAASDGHPSALREETAPPLPRALIMVAALGAVAAAAAVLRRKGARP